MWAVTLRYGSGDPDGLERWEEALEAFDAATAVERGGGVTLTLYVDAADPIAAASAAAVLAAPVTAASPVGVTVADEEAHLAAAYRTNLPDLVSAPEVAERLGVSRQRVHQLQNAPGFPAPLYRLRTGPVWDALAIATFAKTWERRPGRPAGTRAS